MDKFGIFNLLNSFFNFYDKEKQDKSEDKPKENDNSSDPTFSVDNLFSQFKDKNSEKSEPSTNNFSKENKPFNINSIVESRKTSHKNPPLQQQMLSAMKNHDEFIKRVTKNQQNKNK